MVSIRPSDMPAEPLVIAKPNRRQVAEIANVGLDRLHELYSPPMGCDEDRFYIKAIPSVWVNCIRDMAGSSIRYVSLKAYALMASDESIQQLRRALHRVRSGASFSGYLDVMVGTLPLFHSIIPTEVNSRSVFRLWSKEINEELSVVSQETGVSKKSLLMGYGSMALLSSETDLGDKRQFIEDDVRQFKSWIDGLSGILARLQG